MRARRAGSVDQLVYAGANVLLLSRVADKAVVDAGGARTRMSLFREGVQLCLR